MRLLEGHQRFRVRIFGFCVPHRSKKSHTVGLVVTQAVLGVHDPPEPCLQSVESAQIDDTVGKTARIAFSSDCWQSIMKLPALMSNWSHLFRKIDSASLIDVVSSCWIMNSATTEYPTFVWTTRKNNGSASLHVLYVASISTRFGYL